MDAVRSHVRASCHGMDLRLRRADRKLLAASNSPSSMPIHARLNEHVNECSSRYQSDGIGRSIDLPPWCYREIKPSPELEIL